MYLCLWSLRTEVITLVHELLSEIQNFSWISWLLFQISLVSLEDSRSSAFVNRVIIIKPLHFLIYSIGQHIYMVVHVIFSHTMIVRVKLFPLYGGNNFTISFLCNYDFFKCCIFSYTILKIFVVNGKGCIVTSRC